MTFTNPMQQQVAEFHRKFGQPVGGIDEGNLIRLLDRQGWLEEEVVETRVAINGADMPGLVDGLIDTIYIAIGTLVELGVDAQVLFDEVHRANMRKVQAGPGEKIKKPVGWVGPDMLAALARATIRNDR